MKLKDLRLELEEARSRWLSLIVVECQIRNASSGFR